MDRRWGFICFQKGACGNEECLCSASATKATNVMKFPPTSDKWLLPPITPCPEKPDQYHTFRQQARALSFSKPDQHMKGVFNESYPRCRYVLTSESDQVRHIKLVHGGTRAMASVGMELRSLEVNGRKVRSVNAQCVTKLSMAAIKFVNIRMPQGTS